MDFKFTVRRDTATNLPNSASATDTSADTGARSARGTQAGRLGGAGSPSALGSTTPSSEAAVDGRRPSGSGAGAGAGAERGGPLPDGAAPASPASRLTRGNPTTTNTTSAAATATPAAM
jgi:hypothetical protein